jgi:hypothetical protein
MERCKLRYSCCISGAMLGQESRRWLLSCSSSKVFRESNLWTSAETWFKPLQFNSYLEVSQSIKGGMAGTRKRCIPHLWRRVLRTPCKRLLLRLRLHWSRHRCHRLCPRRVRKFRFHGLDRQGEERDYSMETSVKFRSGLTSFSIVASPRRAQIADYLSSLPQSFLLVPKQIFARQSCLRDHYFNSYLQQKSCSIRGSGTSSALKS